MARGDFGRSPGGERLDAWETFTDLVDRFNQDDNRLHRIRVAQLLVVFAVLVFVLIGLIWIGVG